MGKRNISKKSKSRQSGSSYTSVQRADPRVSWVATRTPSVPPLVMNLLPIKRWLLCSVLNVSTVGAKVNAKSLFTDKYNTDRYTTFYIHEVFAYTDKVPAAGSSFPYLYLQPESSTTDTVEQVKIRSEGDAFNSRASVGYKCQGESAISGPFKNDETAFAVIYSNTPNVDLYVHCSFY